MRNYITMAMRVLRRVTGIGAAGSLAFALLTGGCVLAATAGPRQAQATSARALQQTVNAASPLDRSIVVTSSWETINGDITTATYSTTNKILAPADLASLTTQLRRDITGSGPLPLAPRQADWAGMTTAPHLVLSRLPAIKTIPVKLEIAGRYPMAGHLRLVSGSMPGAAPRSGDPTFDVAVTPQTASRLGLRLGSRVLLAPPAGQLLKIWIVVTGIAQPADPGSQFWGTDPLLATPALDDNSGSLTWLGAVIASPAELAPLQQLYGPEGLAVQWEFPVGTTGPHGQVQPMLAQLNRITNRTPELTGPLAPAADGLTVSSGLLVPLARLNRAMNAVNVLLWMVYAGLGLAGVVVLLLAARMIATSQSAEMTQRRARGASLPQMFGHASLGAALACVPAAALAWGLAVLLLPDSAPAGPAAWWPGLVTLAFAAMGPGLIAAWQHRLPRRRRARRHGRLAPRVVFEVAACLAAIGAIIVLRQQGGATGLFTSMAPVLVAVPAVIVVLRLYRLLLRGLARASARQRGVIGIVSLTRAAQATATLALPAMTLVLALTAAAFTAMMRDAVLRGETTVSWQEAGADVVIAPSGQPGIALGISPSAVRAIAAVPGVQHAATALELPVNITGGGQVTAIAVDPASYAALVASTQGFPPVSTALLTQPRGQGVIPVLASPQAAADLSGPGAATIAAQQGLPALRVRVAGTLSATPALPSGGPFIVLPASAIGGSSDPPVNLMLLTGPAISITRLHAAVQETWQGADPPAITTRSQALHDLTGAPLQQGTFLMFSLAIAAAAALGLAVMLLELALGAADREVTLARLATMGLAARQRVLLSALEVLPALAGSALAAVACALALPRIVAPALDLSALTRSQAPVPLSPDFASFLLPLAGLLGVTLIALAYEIRTGRGRGIAVTMRT